MRAAGKAGGEAGRALFKDDLASERYGVEVEAKGPPGGEIDVPERRRCSST